MNDAKKRMTAAVGEILSAMQDGDTVAVVSHAAAICAFLLNWCIVEVVDAQKKLRKITYNGETVLNGKIAAPGAFILKFEDEQLHGIQYVDVENETPLWGRLSAARNPGFSIAPG